MSRPQSDSEGQIALDLPRRVKEDTEGLLRLLRSLPSPWSSLCSLLRASSEVPARVET